MLGMWVLLEAVFPLSVDTWPVGVARNHFEEAHSGPASYIKSGAQCPV